MKKLISLLMAIALIAVMAVGCATNEQKPADEESTSEESTTEENIPDDSSDDTTDDNTDDSDVDIPDVDLSELEVLINDILAIQPVEFMGGSTVLDLTDTSEDGIWMLTRNTGLTSAEKITDAAIFEPMIGSIAYSMVVVKVADAADAQTVAQEMKDGIDVRKWVCVEANELLVCGYGDTVMLIMLDNDLGLTAQGFVDAYQTVCGGTLDFILE